MQIGEPHCHGRHLPDDLGIGPILEFPHATWRKRVGEQKQLVVQEVTPGASIAVAQLHKINGAVEFGAPAKRLHLADAGIDLHEGTGAQQRVKREVLQPDVPILTVPDIQMLNQSDGDFSPELDHARKKIGVIQIEGPVETHGERNRTIRVTDLQFSQMGVRERGRELMKAQPLQVEAVKKQEIGELRPVDGAQAVELEDARDGVRILDLREPGVGDLVFRIMLGAGNLLAQLRHLARGDAQPQAQFLQLFVGQSRSHGFLSYLKQDGIAVE